VTLAAVALLFLVTSEAPARVTLGFPLLLIVFLVPGVFIAAMVTRTLDLTFLGISVLGSYALYGTIALVARGLGLGYDFFYTAFFLATATMVFLYGRSAAARTRLRLHRASLGVIAIAVLVTTAYFQLPPLNDQGLFDGNIFASRLRRDFAPSNTDVVPFGLSAPQPRMLANLYHTFYALASELLDIGPRTLTMHVANPFLGIFVVVLMTALIWELCGRQIDPIFALASVISAFVLWFEPGNPYWYYFRLLNGPTVDKDFALFVLLPALTICAYRYLREAPQQASRWLLLLGFGAIAAAFSHPVTPTYLVLNSCVLGVALFRWRLVRRLMSLGGVVLGSCLLVLVTIRPADTHYHIEELAQYDLANSERLHFWGGHYVTADNPDSSIRFYTGTQIPLVRPVHIFRSPWVRQSAVFTLLWAGLLLVSRLLRGFRRKEAWRDRKGVVRFSLTIASASAAAVAILRIDMLDGALRPEVTAVAMGLCLLSLLLTGVASTLAREHAPRCETLGDREEQGMRLQTSAMATLVVVFALTSVVLYRQPELWRGVDRLHWFYFGGFSVAFVFGRLFTAVRLGVATLFGRLGHGLEGAWLRRAVIVPHLLVAAIVGDQTAAAFSGEPSIAQRSGLLRPYVDHPWFKARRSQLRPWIDLRSPEDLPAWLRDEDRVLCFDYLYEYIAPVRSRLAYYRELYSEAYAYQQLGEPFLQTFHAYNDLLEGEVTHRALSLLRRQEVSLIVLGRWNQNLENELRGRWSGPVTQVAPNILRLGRPDSG
jgi:hypothetical protein